MLHSLTTENQIPTLPKAQIQITPTLPHDQLSSSLSCFKEADAGVAAQDWPVIPSIEWELPRSSSIGWAVEPFLRTSHMDWVVFSFRCGWLSSIGKYWVVLSCIRKALLPLEISRLCLSSCSLDHVTSSHQYDQSLKRSDTLLGFVGWNIRIRL